MKLASTSLQDPPRSTNIGAENSCFLRWKETISALEALCDALYKSTTTTTTQYFNRVDIELPFRQSE